MTDELWCDVSWWNGLVDFHKMAMAGAKGVILRLGSINNTTGQCYEDREIRRNAAEAPKVFGEKVGGYWYFRPNHDAIKQAQFVVKMLVQLPVIQFVGNDIEVAGNIGPVKTFSSYIADYYGTPKKSPVYTNPNTWLYLLSGDKTWAKIFQLWQAQWNISAPTNLAPWTACQRVIWQYSANGNHRGAEFGNGPCYNVDTGRYDALPTVNMDLDKVNVEWARDVCGVVVPPVVPTLEQKLERLWAAHPELH